MKRRLLRQRERERECVLIMLVLDMERTKLGQERMEAVEREVMFVLCLKRGME